MGYLFYVTLKLLDIFFHFGWYCISFETDKITPKHNPISIVLFRAFFVKLIKVLIKLKFDNFCNSLM